MTSSDLRCPSCGAHARSEAEWCTLCYAALRTPVQEPEVPPAGPRGGLPGGPRGRHAKGASGGAPTTSYDAAGDGAAADGAGRALPDVDTMLAQLATESRSSLDSMSGHVGTGGRKIAIISGGVVAVGMVLFLVMSVVGALL